MEGLRGAGDIGRAGGGSQERQVRRGTQSGCPVSAYPATERVMGRWESERRFPLFHLVVALISHDSLHPPWLLIQPLGTRSTIPLIGRKGDAQTGGTPTEVLPW